MHADKGARNYAFACILCMFVSCMHTDAFLARNLDGVVMLALVQKPRRQRNVLIDDAADDDDEDDEDDSYEEGESDEEGTRCADSSNRVHTQPTTTRVALPNYHMAWY